MRSPTPLSALLILIPLTFTLVYAAPFSRPEESATPSPNSFNYRLPRTAIVLQFDNLPFRPSRRIYHTTWDHLVNVARRNFAEHGSTRGGPSAIFRQDLSLFVFGLRLSITPLLAEGGATYGEVDLIVSTLLVARQPLNYREFLCRIYRTNERGQRIGRIGAMMLEYHDPLREQVATSGIAAENLTVAGFQAAPNRRQLITSRQIDAATSPATGGDGGGATSNNIIPFTYHVRGSIVLLEAHNIPEHPIRYVSPHIWTQVLLEARRRLLMRFGATGLKRNMHDTYEYTALWTEVDVWPNTEQPMPTHFATYEDAYEVLRGMYDIAGRARYQELWIDFYRTNMEGTERGILLGHATFENKLPFEETTNQTAVAEVANGR
ncbi:MAG: hypothetical protein Q9167_007951 [Letrouitia subvulpina]